MNIKLICTISKNVTMKEFIQWIDAKGLSKNNCTHLQADVHVDNWVVRDNIIDETYVRKCPPPHSVCLNFKGHRGCINPMACA